MKQMQNWNEIWDELHGEVMEKVGDRVRSSVGGDVGNALLWSRIERRVWNRAGWQVRRQLGARYEEDLE